MPLFQSQSYPKEARKINSLHVKYAKQLEELVKERYRGAYDAAPLVYSAIFVTTDLAAYNTHFKGRKELATLESTIKHRFIEAGPKEASAYNQAKAAFVKTLGLTKPPISHVDYKSLNGGVGSAICRFSMAFTAKLYEDDPKTEGPVKSKLMEYDLKTNETARYYTELTNAINGVLEKYYEEVFHTLDNADNVR